MSGYWEGPGRGWGRRRKRRGMWGWGQGYGPGYGPGWGPGWGPPPQAWWGWRAQAQPPEGMPRLSETPEGWLRVVVPAEGPGLEAPVSPVLGRAPYFVVVDVSPEGEVREQSVQNPLAQAPGPAGAGVAQWIASIGAGAVAAASVGPNAAMVLESAGIMPVPVRPDSRVKDVVEFVKRSGPGY